MLSASDHKKAKKNYIKTTTISNISTRSAKKQMMTKAEILHEVRTHRQNETIFNKTIEDVKGKIKKLKRTKAETQKNC